MSVENAKAFIEQAQGDEAIQEKLKALKPESKEEALAAVVKVAAEHGHSFEAEHYEEAVKAHLKAQHAAGGKLSDEELDAVAGGKCLWYAGSLNVVASVGVIIGEQIVNLYAKSGKAQGSARYRC